MGLLTRLLDRRARVLPPPSTHRNRRARELAAFIQAGGRARLVDFRDNPGGYDIPIIAGYWPLITNVVIFRDPPESDDETVAFALADMTDDVYYAKAEEYVTFAPAK